MDDLLDDIYHAIIAGDNNAITAHVQAAVEAGVAAAVILQEGMIPAMDEVGSLFENGEYYVPDMLIAARAMQEGLTVLRPALVDAVWAASASGSACTMPMWLQ